MKDAVAERPHALWLLIVSPTLWGVHFMLCYTTAAVWCGRYASPQDSLDTVRIAIAAYTVVALAGIGAVAYIGFRRHRFGAAQLPHDDDSPEDRHRFLGFSTFLLSGLSFVAVIYSALAAVFIETCQ